MVFSPHLQVVQEAASAPHGQVLWGNGSFEWAKLMRVYIWMSARASSIYYAYPFGEVQINSHMAMYLEGNEDFGRVFYHKASWGTPSVLRTLNYAKELDLSDPRDRIYAFMDLIRCSEQHIRLEPDYSVSHLETYRQFALRYILSAKDFKLLEYVCHDVTSLVSGIPSWVPRWDIITWSLSQSSTTSSVMQSRNLPMAEPKIHDNSNLRVRGIVIDTICFVSELFEWETTTVDTIRKIWKHVSAESTDCPYAKWSGNASYQLNAFLDSLSAGTYDGEFSEWRIAAEQFRHEAQLQPENVGDDSQLEDNPARNDDARKIFLEHVRNRTHNRRFVLTQRGYMGLAPLPTMAGDSCAIIFGCKLPSILRATSPGHYMFVGTTAIMGRQSFEAPGGGVMFCKVLGAEDSQDWIDWDGVEQDIYLC
jgi:hypothetical protein